MVEHVDDGNPTVDEGGLALQHHAVEFRDVLQLEIDALQQPFHEAHHLDGPHRLHDHDLEDHALGRRHLRARPAVDQERDAAGGDLFGREEGQRAVVLLADAHAVVLLQDAAGGGEQLSRRHGIADPERDEVRLVAQVRRDVEGKA